MAHWPVHIDYRNPDYDRLEKMLRDRRDGKVSLFQCSVCGGKVASDATACPHCGHAVSKDISKNDPFADCTFAEDGMCQSCGKNKAVHKSVIEMHYGEMTTHCGVNLCLPCSIKLEVPFCGRKILNRIPEIRKMILLDWEHCY